MGGEAAGVASSFESLELMGLISAPDVPAVPAAAAVPAVDAVPAMADEEFTGVTGVAGDADAVWDAVLLLLRCRALVGWGAVFGPGGDTLVSGIETGPAHTKSFVSFSDVWSKFHGCLFFGSAFLFFTLCRFKVSFILVTPRVSSGLLSQSASESDTLVMTSPAHTAHELQTPSVSGSMGCLLYQPRGKASARARCKSEGCKKTGR